jgi:hypothetical protein
MAVGLVASATTRFSKVSLQRRREVLGRNAMTVLPAQIQTDIVGMFGYHCKVVSNVRSRREAFDCCNFFALRWACTDTHGHAPTYSDLPRPT